MTFCACNLIFERLSQVFTYMKPVWKVLMGSCKQNDLYKAFTDMKFNRLMVKNFWAAKKFWCCFNAFYNIMNPSFKKLTRKKHYWLMLNSWIISSFILIALLFESDLKVWCLKEKPISSPPWVSTGGGLCNYLPTCKDRCPHYRFLFLILFIKNLSMGNIL